MWTTHNTVRLQDAIGFATPADKLAGRKKEIHDARDHKLEEAEVSDNCVVNRPHELRSYDGFAR